ncbi:MAG: RNA polymerase sigma factor [Planctomycetes bacterium]|nr:RNA polymerase sigma factor [Planctomycetota bacterium]
MTRDDLAALVRIHQAEVYRYVRYLGAEAHAAEDLVQETFLAAFRSDAPPEAADVRGAAAWLRGIARNLFLRYCRSRKTSPVKVDSALVERAEGVWASEFLRGGDGFDYVEALRKCLDALSEKQRHVLDLRYAQKKSRSEMARLLEMSEDGIKSLLRRIRAALAECVRRRLASEEPG